MKRITVSVEKKVLSRAEARRRMRALSDRSTAKIGDVSWTRDQLHDR